MPGGMGTAGIDWCITLDLFNIISILFYNTTFHTQLKQGMEIMIDQRPGQSLLLATSLSQAGTAWLREGQLAVRPERWGGEGGPFPSPRSAGKLSVGELTVRSLFLTLLLRNHHEIFSLGLTGCIF